MVLELELLIEPKLIQLGIPQHIKGYIYIKTAIAVLMINNNLQNDDLHKKIYPIIVKKIFHNFY